MARGYRGLEQAARVKKRYAAIGGDETMRIYTRTGDQGETALFGGNRVSKGHLRLQASGSLDELNSVIGILRMKVSEATAVGETLRRIQRALFALGTVLAIPAEQLPKLDARMSRSVWSTDEMERDIDRLAAMAPPVTCFVLPGGGEGSAFAHWACTVCRRAEREIATLSAEENVMPTAMAYINRLSDWLFALSRAENAVNGVPDEAWNPESIHDGGAGG
jgi:cob(I)alamin adenosyltransferase